MTELHALFDRATDSVEDPRLEQVALQTAWRRRTRRRGAVAAGVASSLVVAIVVGTQVGGDRTGGAPPVGPPASQTPSAPTSGPPEVSEKVWPKWDPREVDDLPAAAGRTVPAVPEVIDPPASSPPLADSTVDAAVLAVEQGDVAQVLGIDGVWRSVPLDGRFPRLELSPGGTRLAVHYGFDNQDPDHDYGVWVHDLATGESRLLAPPKGFEPWDDTGWEFLDEDALLFTSPESYLVAVDTGEAEKAPYRLGLSRTVDPAGNVLVSADWSESNVLTDYAGGAPREVSMARTGRLSGILADEDTVVGTTYDNRPFSVVVADRETLTPQVVLPIVDTDANYSNWGLGPVALVDDGTVLLRVPAIGRGATGFRLVLWDPAAGDLSILSSTGLPVETPVVFVSGLLRDTSP